MTTLLTRICLPPTFIEESALRRFLFQALEQFKWLLAVKYGFPSPSEELNPEHIDYDAVVDVYKSFGSVCLSDKTEQNFILVYSPCSTKPSYVDSIKWCVSNHVLLRPSWHGAHAQQVATMMELLRSPLAQTAVDEDFEQKTRRLVDDGISLVKAFTIRGYSEGLAGLFWRNFYGPPFVRLFGERLNSLPAECVTRLGEELVLVQPYELPTEAGTEAARTREQQLISLLGPECFYDHEHHRPPTRRPVLEPPPGSDP